MDELTVGSVLAQIFDELGRWHSPLECSECAMALVERLSQMEAKGELMLRLQRPWPKGAGEQ